MMIKRWGLLLLVVLGCSGQKPLPTPTESTTSNSATLPSTGTEVSSDASASSNAGNTASSDPQSKPTEPEPPFQLEEGFTQLGFADFEAFGAEASTWEGAADGIKCTGKPRGYLYSKQPYQNFTLRLDYRFPRPANLKDEAKFKGNTGFLVYITGEHKLWPVCLEVQGKHVQMAAIKENGGAQPVTATDDDAARQKARRAIGQWNSLEIVSTNGALKVSLNGTPVSTCEPDFLSEGSIGIQSEDHPFEVRRLRIRQD
jgi:hypothetical protein